MPSVSFPFDAQLVSVRREVCPHARWDRGAACLDDDPGRSPGLPRRGPCQARLLPDDGEDRGRQRAMAGRFRRGCAKAPSVAWSSGRVLRVASVTRDVARFNRCGRRPFPVRRGRLERQCDDRLSCVRACAGNARCPRAPSDCPGLAFAGACAAAGRGARSERRSCQDQAAGPGTAVAASRWSWRRPTRMAVHAAS